MRNPAVTVLGFLWFLLLSPLARAGQQEGSTTLPFNPDEKLTYEISWSNIVHAGTAVMEVKEEPGPGGKTVYHVVSTAKSGKLLSAFYKVSDRVESFIDIDGMHTLSFRLDQRHGKRTKKRDMTFDHEKGTVLVLSDGRQDTYPVPEDVQDALSSLYYVRTKQDFIVGRPITVNVHEDGKTWSVEVLTLGREKVRTPLGEFNTIKIKTYPRYEGVFQNKGEIFIWLTDDARKVPVLMKSTISIGSIVSTLVEMRSGREKNADTDGIKTSLQNR